MWFFSIFKYGMFLKRWGIHLFLLLCAILMTSAHIIIPAIFYKPVDLYTYLYATQKAYTGADVYAQNIFGYGLPQEGLPFVYTPFSFIPLSLFAFFPVLVSYFLWTLVTYITLYKLLQLFVDKGSATRWTFVLVCTNIMIQHGIWGQINIFLAYLCCYDLLKAEARWHRFVPRGVLVGIAAGIKLTPLLFLAYFFITKQWKTLITSVISFLSTIAIGFLLFPISSKDYFTQQIWNLSSKVDLGVKFAEAGNSSIQGYLAALHLRIPAVVVPSLIMTGILVMFTAWKLYNAHDVKAAVLTIGLGACMLSPVSWIHHWVYLLPAIAYISELVSRRLAILLVTPLVLQLSDLGPWFIDHGPAVLTPIYWIIRESILLASILSIAIFYKHYSSSETTVKR